MKTMSTVLMVSATIYMGLLMLSYEETECETSAPNILGDWDSVYRDGYNEGYDDGHEIGYNDGSPQ